MNPETVVFDRYQLHVDPATRPDAGTARDMLARITARVGDSNPIRRTSRRRQPRT